MIEALRFSSLKTRLSPVNYGPIGLEFSQGKLNMMQLATPGVSDQCRIQALSSSPYPCAPRSDLSSRDLFLASPQALTTIVKQVLNTQPFKGRKVATVLPSDWLRTFSLRFQLPPGQGEDEAIRALLSERLQENLADLVIDYVPTRHTDTSNDRRVVAAVARREDVINYLELLRKSGLEVDSLEIGQVAIRRLITTLNSNRENHNSLVINFGNERSYITMISGRRLLFDHSIDTGEEKLLSRLTDELEIDKAQLKQLMLSGEESPAGNTTEQEQVRKLAFNILLPDLKKLDEEIRRTLVFAASELRGSDITCIYLLGSLARWQ
ncbi:MAG: pilus assembly protein PilM, partial [Pontibacterium sp.]